MAEFLLSLMLRHWRSLSIVLLAAGFVGAVYLAQARGAALRETREMLEERETQYRQTLQILEQNRKVTRERLEFRTLQSRSLKEGRYENLLLDAELRAAYERLRERQSAGATR